MPPIVVAYNRDMNGPSRVAEQTRNGVRGIVQEIDELRCRFGATALNMLTPKAEVSPTQENFGMSSSVMRR